MIGDGSSWRPFCDRKGFFFYHLGYHHDDNHLRFIYPFFAQLLISMSGQLSKCYYTKFEGSRRHSLIIWGYFSVWKVSHILFLENWWYQIGSCFCFAFCFDFIFFLDFIFCFIGYSVNTRKQLSVVSTNFAKWSKSKNGKKTSCNVFQTYEINHLKTYSVLR